MKRNKLNASIKQALRTDSSSTEITVTGKKKISREASDKVSVTIETNFTRNTTDVEGGSKMNIVVRP